MLWQDYKKQQDRESRSIFLTVVFCILAIALLLCAVFVSYEMITRGVTILNCFYLAAVILAFIYCALSALDSKKKEIRDRLHDLFIYLPWWHG